MRLRIIMSTFALYTAIAILFYLVLTYRVIILRYRRQVGIGDGGDDELARAIRIHGNFAEYVPFLLILMLLITQTGVLNAWLHLFGSGMILGRLLHIWGLTRTSEWSWQRASGTLLTHILMLAGALYCLCYYVPIGGVLRSLQGLV